MMQIDEQVLDQKSNDYADRQLGIANPQMSQTSYSRHIKMKSPCFTGNDIAQAYEDGYREAWKDKCEVPPEKEYYGQ